MVDAADRICPRCESITTARMCPNCELGTTAVQVDERYRILQRLGRGGMATVWTGVQVTTDRHVAIKVLDDTSEMMVARFRREARLSSKLEHPNAVRIYDYGVSSDGQPYLVMEQLRGQDLRRELQEKGPMALPRAVKVCTQVLKALGAAHSLNVIHRDIKPANIFLHHEADGTEVVKVMDFGIATLVGMDADQAKVTTTGQVMGTPAYMSPEQLQEHPLDGRTDIYAVGLVFYELITGKTAFTAENPMALAMKQVHQAPPPIGMHRPELAGRTDIEAVLTRLLAKSPDQRPVSALHATALLQHLLPQFTDDISKPELLAMKTADFSSLAQQARRDAAPIDLTPARGVARSASPATVQIDVATQPVAPPPPMQVAKPKPIPYVAAGIGALGLAAVAVVAWPRATPQPPPVPVATVETPAPTPQPAPAQTVTLVITSDPAGAIVAIDGAQLGPTPVRHAVPRGTQAVKVVVEKAGYAPQVLTVVPSADRELSAVLTRQVAPVRKKPSGTAKPRKDTEPAGSLEPEEL